MRNGVLGVMGEVVITRLSQDELDENMKKTRDQILDRLEVGIIMTQGELIRTTKFLELVLQVAARNIRDIF